MKNTKWAIGLLMMFVFAFCGCEKDMTYVIEGGYETIDGEYKVEVTEVEDTCYGDLSDPWQDILDVLVQEEYDDGTYLADVVISNEVWLPEVKVESDGDVNYEYYDEWRGQNSLFNGKLTPREVDVTLELQAVDLYGEVYCYIVYELKGTKRYLSAPPSE